MEALLMNIFSDKIYKLNPECPCCKGIYSNLIAKGDNWKEWVCLNCRRVYVEKNDKIEIRGKA